MPGPVFYQPKRGAIKTALFLVLFFLVDQLTSLVQGYEQNAERNSSNFTSRKCVERHKFQCISPTKASVDHQQ